MKKPSFTLTAWAAFLLITVLCQTDFTPAGRMPSTVRDISAGLAAAPTSLVEYTLKLPLLVDSGDGRLYGLVAAGGQDDRIAVYSSRDGHPLANYPYKGPFTLDAKGHRLFVMSGPDRVAVIDARTGKPLATFRVGSAAGSPAPLVAPQYDPQANQLLVFTGNVMTTLDATTGKQLGSAHFDVAAQDRCRTPVTTALPVTRSFFDTERRLVYLEFVTYSCIPWIGFTVVAYDLTKGAEISRQTTEPYSGLAAKGGFYAMAWHRFGIGTIWTERDGKPGYRVAGWSAGDPFQLDTRRGRLYQSGDGSIRIFDLAGMTLTAVAPQPVKGVLAAYDPVSDQVYFVDGATVRPWPAAKLGSSPASPSKVKGTPNEPVRLIVPAPNWQQEKTLFAVWSRPWPDMTCYVFNQSGGDMLRSLDGGKQWLLGRAGLPTDCGQVSALAVSPGYPKDRTLMTGIKGNGIFKSTDGGASWRPGGNGLPQMAVGALALSPGFATDRTAFASVSDFGLQRSQDGGASWESLPTSAGPILLALSPEFESDRTLAISGNRAVEAVLQISEDRGDHWRNLTAPPTSNSLRLLSLAPAFARWHVMFAGDANGDLYRSPDGGRSWQRVLQPGLVGTPGTGAEQVQIAYGPNEERREVFLVVSGTRYEGEKRVPWGRLFRSGDGGQSWAEMDAGRGVTPTALAISPNYARDRLLFVGAAGGRILQIQPPMLQ